MPIQRCTLPNGGSGWRYGREGKCYKSRKRAILQMKAIKYSQTHSAEFTKEEIESFLEDLKAGRLEDECCPEKG